MGKSEDAAALLQQAQAYSKTDTNDDEALETAQKALAAFRELKDHAGKADALRIAIPLLKKNAKGKPVEALKLCTEEMDLFKEAGDRRGEAAMMLALAEVNMDRRGSKKREEALQMAKDALGIFVELGDKKLQADTTTCVANTLVKKCDRCAGPKLAREAAKYAGEAVVLYRELGDQKSEAMAMFFQFSAKMHTECPMKDGLKHAKEAAAIFKELGHKWWEGCVMNTIADWYSMRGSGKEGLPYAREAQAIFSELGNTGHAKGWEASALGALINGYASKDDPESAIKVAQDAMTRFKASGDKMMEAHANSLLSNAYTVDGNHEDALKCAEAALALVQELDDKRSEAYLRNHIAEMHMKAENPTDALAACQDSFALAEQLGDTRHQARNKSLKLRVLIGKGETDEALQVATEALELYDKSGDKEGQAVVMLNLASCYAAKERFGDAAAEADEARTMFAALENKTREAEALFFLADIHTRNQQHQEALDAATSARLLYHKLGDKPGEASMLIWMEQSNVSLAMKIESNGKANRTVKKLFSSAMKAAKESLAIAKKLGDKDSSKSILFNAYSSVAEVLGLTGRYQDALKTAREALKVAQENNERANECNALMLIGRIHNWNGESGEAKNFARNALAVAQKKKDQYLESMASYFLYQLEPEAGRKPEFAADSAGYQGAPGGNQQPVPGALPIPKLTDLIPKINSMAMSLLNQEELHQDSPLMDSGLDSLSMVQFRNTLQQGYPGVPMPASLIFDYPSVRAVAQNIIESLQASNSRQLA